MFTNKKYFVLLGLFLLAGILSTQANANPSYSVSPSSSSVRFNITTPSGNSAPSEGPPPLVNGGWKTYFLFGENSTYCSTPESLHENRTSINCNSSYSDYIYGADYLKVNSTAALPNTPWRSEYYGAMAVDYFTAAEAQKSEAQLVAINHGEQKNMTRNGTTSNPIFYQNSINQNVEATPGPASAPFSTPTTGYYHCPEGLLNNWSAPGSYLPAIPDPLTNRPSTSPSSNPIVYYHNCHAAYNGFISSSTNNSTVSNGYGKTGWQDRGPIVWPQAGYLKADNTKASWGVRHPSSFVANGYQYVYFSDTSGAPSVNEGNIKVARAPINQAGNPGAYTTKQANGSWQSSLPYSFNKNSTSSFYKQGSGAQNTANVLPEAPRGVKFSVARVAGTSKVIGIIQRYVPNFCGGGEPGWKVDMYTSDVNDPTSFGYGVQLDAPLGSCNLKNSALYPIFLRADGTSNQIVDASGFWVLGGDGANNGVKKTWVKINSLN